MLEHFHHSRPLPRLQSSMALDGVLELRGMVAPCGLVRNRFAPVGATVGRLILYTGAACCFNHSGTIG